MSEVEKQESQKTVVSFITGLLIGGLLVWVFSSSPEEKKQPEEKTTDTEVVAESSDATKEVVAETKSTSSEVIGKGSITVADQKAGLTVTLSGAEFPTKNGWVVVRDYMDGVPGNILGAARYSADEGLAPEVVDLMRATSAGSSYQAVFYTNEGDGGFDLAEDKLIDGVAVTFKTN